MAKTIAGAALALALTTIPYPAGSAEHGSNQGRTPQRTASIAQQPHAFEIGRNGILVMVRSVLLAVDTANKTGNYTVLRDMGSPTFAATTTSATLTELFTKQRKDHVDLSGVAAIDPQITLLPQIEPNGALHMKGFFPSATEQINFDILWTPVDNQWRLSGLAVTLAPSTPPAPSSAPMADAGRSATTAPPPLGATTRGLRNKVIPGSVAD